MQSLDDHQSKCLIEALNEHATVAMTNYEGEILYVNEKFCNISGYTEKELLGNNPRVLNSGYHDQSFFEDLWANIKSGKTWQGEIRNKKKNGTLYFTSTTIVPFLCKQQKNTRFIAILNDISDRVLAQNSIQDINGVLNSVIEASPFAIIGLDKNYEVKIWNVAATHMFSLGKEQMIGKSFLKKYPELQSIFCKSKSKMFVADTDYNIHMMGKDLCFSLSTLDYSLIHEDQGILLMVKDVSVQRNMEREILAISDHEQLRIGHDLHDVLGQNLTAIQLKLKILQDQFQATTPKLAQKIKSIAFDFKLATGFVKDFAETLGPLKIENLGLAYVLNNFTDSIETSFKIPCSFECNFNPKLSQEVSTQLYRIATEACMNAVKYSKAKQIEIQLLKSNNLLTLVIQDNGHGFDDGLSDGMGLHIMKYRANAIQASFLIESSQLGTTILVKKVIE